MNRIIMVGYIAKDIELHRSQNDNTYVRTRISVPRRDKETDFFSLVAFGKTAEFMDKYLVKGSKIIVKGHLQPSAHEKNGVKYYDIDIIAEQIEFAGGKDKRDENADLL